MRKIFMGLLAVLMGVSLLVAPQSVTAAESDTQTNERYLIPKPLSFEETDGEFVLTNETKFYVNTDDEVYEEVSNNTANYLKNKLETSTGFTLSSNKGEHVGTNFIEFAIVDEEALGNEGYRIEATSDGIVLKAYQTEGLYNAMQTLRQLFPAEIESSEVVEDVNWIVPTCTIYDKPEYEYRGMMLDVARHFFTVDQVKRQIDLAAQYKINKLHMHLSDDQGWRLEILGTIGEGDEEESLSKLTELGASTSCSSNGYRPGYYTQEDFKELVAYAAEHYVEIIPEFDMPGHAWAALVSLEYLNSTADKKPHAGGYDNSKPYEGWDVGWASLECHNEHTYEFIEEVIKQVSAISPSKYFHIGGDEAHSTSSEDYSYFMNRVAEIAKKYGKTPIGWQHFDNVTEDKEGTIAQFWSTGSSKMNAGVNYIASPADYAYIDMKYPNDDSGLGLQWAAKISPQRAYSWDPTNYGSKDQIIGIEAPLWAETLTSNDAWDHMIYPRLAGHAEIGWTRKENRSWDEYKTRLIQQKARWDYEGVKFYQDEDIWVTPVEEVNAQFLFDEGEGTVTYDLSEKYTGTLMNASFTEGKHGTALKLDGTGYVDLDIEKMKGDWTISAWVRNDGSNNDTNAVIISGSEGEIKLNQYKNTGKVGVTKFGVVDATFDYSAPVGEWVYLTFVGTDSTTSLYVNGESKGTINVGITAPIKRIGANLGSGMASAGKMNGALDDLTIFNSALDADAVKALYDKATAPDATVFQFNENTGNTTTDTTNTYTGTINTSANSIWTTDVHGNEDGSALQFDGANSVDLNMEIAGDWSISMWIKNGDMPGTDSTLMGNSTGDIKLEQWKNTGKMGVTIYGDNDYTFEYSAPKDEWTYITFTAKESTKQVALYVNGTLVGSHTLGKFLPAPVTTFGRNARTDLAGRGNIQAAVDDLNISYVCLNSAEVKALYKENLQPELAELLAKINEAEALNKDEYTLNSWNKLTEALAPAQKAYKEATSYNVVKAQTLALTSAIAQLERPADFTALDAAIAAANEVKNAADYTTNYTEASRTAFEEALTAADSLSRLLAEKDQEVVDNATEALVNAQAALTLNSADYTAVDAAIEAANKLNKENYKDFSAVEAAIDAVVRGKDITEQAAVDAMAKAIEDAIAALELKAADYTAVDEAIAKAEALDPEDYKDFSAVEAAIDAVVRGKDITEQAAVDAMAKAIEDAIAALEENEDIPWTPIEPSKVNKEELDKAIDDAKAINTSKYTEESVAKLDKALTAAEKVFADKDATQAEVNDATVALNNAIKGLVEKTTDPVDPEEPEKPGDTPNTADNTNIIVFAGMLIASAAYLLISYKRKEELN